MEEVEGSGCAHKVKWERCSKSVGNKGVKSRQSRQTWH